LSGARPRTRESLRRRSGDASLRLVLVRVLPDEGLVSPRGPDLAECEDVLSALLKGKSAAKLKVDVSKLDLEPDEYGEVRVELRLGGLRYMGTGTFGEKRPGRFKYRRPYLAGAF
jgi:hypothetical protein